ncbi:MAG: trypsin-like serine protease [Actinomycetota bacterium]
MPHTRLRTVLPAAIALVLFLAAAAPSSAEPEAAPAESEATTPRIVGGTEVDPPGKYPFIGALVFAAEPDTYWGQFCAGTLIDPWWVLTAGHCVSFAAVDDASEIDVMVGRHDLRNGTDGERIGVADIYRHPGYDNQTLANDLALLRLERAATAGTPLDLATAADAGLFEAGDLATVIGWGATQGNPPGTPNYPDELREVQVPIVADADCATAYGSDFILPDQICAGDFVNGGIDSCFGDSGGPLFVPAGGGYLHVGIVSSGNGCALPGFPGIYTRTATYAGWIDSVLADNPVPSCHARTATLLGTVRADTLRGTAGDDVIIARAGHDTIRGLGGADLICSGPGNDWVDAGRGNDTVVGGAGNDYIMGGSGDDILGGNSGKDRLLGGNGDDRLFGSTGNDTVVGDAGNDLIYGGDGTDRLYGGAGADRIAGFPGDDIISGGPGNDRLAGNEGFDLLRGGLGIDICVGGEDVVCEMVRLDFKLPL